MANIILRGSHSLKILNIVLIVGGEFWFTPSAWRDLEVDHTDQQQRTGLEHSCTCRDWRLVLTAYGRCGSPIPMLAPPSQKTTYPESYLV